MLDFHTFAKAVRRRPGFALLPLFENGFFDKMPDEKYLCLEYRALTGKKLDVVCPESFNEKIAWLKLNDHNPLYKKLADKYMVRDFVSNVIGEKWLVPLLGVWKSPDQVDLSSLPQRFVLKCTQGYSGVVICRDKATFDCNEAVKKLEKAYSCDYFSRAREWVYKNPVPRIIAETYVDDGNCVPADYKFMCFNGKVGIVCVSRAVNAAHAGAGCVSFFYPDGSKAPFKRSDYPEFPGDEVLPQSYLAMYEAAERLACASGAPFVRVDFYDVAGKPYFSEFTFYPCGGTMFLDPAGYDLALGELLVLPKEGSAS